ncbi:hypothetical protein N7510_002567 [Penicillium lagena]|uniref:uncharacterized protein n=1 Tax=Penicillium lagena TaxID=94218 RepID=UPI002540CBF6|nr:uncharacterized protein N7510_002567 [Penicillium lagena]KAJ5626258.1 hypothetical protein N7510_002567 [Penicillium lagena]
MNIFSFGDLPTIHTRKALLLLDFQNDFVRPSGALPVPNSADILETLPGLAAAFRRVGDVVWVRSQFESSQSTVDWDFGDRIVLEKEPPPPPKPEPLPDIIEAASDCDTPEPVDDEAFLSADPSPCCNPQTPGFQFPAPILAAIDRDQDTVLDKTGYSALESAGLVLSFRTRFVTELYLCGSLSNVSVYATALDAVRNGFSVTLIEDCLGFRDFGRHQEAMRRMADILGATGLSAEELTRELENDETEAIARRSRNAPPTKKSIASAGIENVMDGLEVDASDRIANNDPSPDREGRSLDDLIGMTRAHRGSSASSQPRVASEGKKAVRARVRRPKRRDPTPDSTITDGGSVAESVTSTRSVASTPPTEILERKIGEGDSRIVHNIGLPPNAFERIRAEVAWQKMYHLSGQVPRLVAVQGQPNFDGAIPIYRHPADESPPLKSFTSAVDEVRIATERILGHPLNHVLIQLYRDGQDRISEHSDKTLDIIRGSFICNVSLGAQRTMTLRTKVSASASNKETEFSRMTQRIPLPHNSLFVLGEKTNMRWLHSIRADKRPDSEKSLEERAYGGERISLTFRNIGTYLNPTADTIWGQGAVSKTSDQARTVIHGDPTETERLIRSFGQENHATEFDWDAVYGGGFDVVNFVTTSSARLALSGDPVADLRVLLCLGENGLRYEVVPVGQDIGIADAPSKRPLYISSDGKMVAGDHSILTHLAKREPTRPGVDVLRGGSRLAQLDGLLACWREHRRRDDEKRLFDTGLEIWEHAVEGQHYLGGTILDVDDCSLWPIVREMAQIQDGFAAQFPHLYQYYHRVGKRGIVRAILEETRLDG